MYAEGWVDFVDELAVMVVRGTTGESKAYPTVSAIQRDSVCRVVVAPARCDEESRRKAEDTARRAIDSMEGATGIYGVELFLCRDGSVLLNEVAPRPHNTGHYTQDACACSQVREGKDRRSENLNRRSENDDRIILRHNNLPTHVTFPLRSSRTTLGLLAVWSSGGRGLSSVQRVW